MTNSSDEYKEYDRYIDQQVMPGIPNFDNKRDLDFWIKHNQTNIKNKKNKQWIKYPTSNTATYLYQRAVDAKRYMPELKSHIREDGVKMFMRKGWKGDLTEAQYFQRMRAFGLKFSGEIPKPGSEKITLSEDSKRFNRELLDKLGDGLLMTKK